MILVTHFDAFGEDTVNSSQLVAQNLPTDVLDNIVLAQLPTSKVDVEQRVPELIAQHTPQAILGMGQAGGRTAPSLEWVAINLLHSTMPDNRGQQHRAVPIDPHGPDAYLTTLPVLQLQESMELHGLPLTLSSSAGLFMCNQALYLFRHHAPTIPSGFLHLPYVPEQVVKKSGIPSMALETQVRIVSLILHDIKDWLAQI
jgi:pyroglutamyl-peptidase